MIYVCHSQGSNEWSNLHTRITSCHFHTPAYPAHTHVGVRTFSIVRTNGYRLRAHFFLFPASAIANYRSTPHSFPANIQCRSKNVTAKTLGKPKKSPAPRYICIYINSICFCAAPGESRHTKLLRLSESGKSKEDKLWFA